MNKEKAKSFVAHMLSSKMYTCREIFEKLVRKGCDEEIAEETVSDFCRVGILNDAEYAKMYVHDAINVNMKGSYRIRVELLKKGVAPSVIDEVLENCEADVEGQLMEYVRLRFQDTVFEDRNSLEKAKAHLMRRGFAISDINKCFKALDIKISRGDEF